MCNYCNAEYYIKVQKFAKSFSAPLTRAGELRQQLENLTGEAYVIIPNKYCPFCGEEIKEEGGLNEDTKFFKMCD